MNHIPEQALQQIREIRQQNKAADREMIARKQAQETESQKEPERNVRKILDSAQQAGCEIRPGKGSHQVLIRSDGKVMSIPVHSENADLGKGLARKIGKFIEASREMLN